MTRLVEIFLILLFCAITPTAGGADVIEKLLFEIHNYTAGEFHGFKIGMSKQAVFEHIYVINPEARITPIPFREFVISAKNLDELRNLNYIQGLRLFNYSGVWVDLLFNDGKISTVSRSTLATNSFSFDVNESIQKALDELKAVLQRDNSLRVIPIVPRPRTGSYDLNNLGSEGKAELFLRNAWEFEAPREKPVGATYRFYFTGDHLERMQYRRARIELP